MSNRFRLGCFLLTFTLLFPVLTVSPSASPSPALSVSAQAAVLMEAGSGEILWSRDADHRLPMASTTKIMTALVALELGDAKQVIRVPREAVGTEGSSVYLFEGEELTLEQLLYALLLESANDAAVAIAVGLCGSVEAFAEQMNRKADALGLLNTHFTNPHGLDHAEHFTSACDLAMMAREALGNELFRTIVATRKATIPHDGTEGVRLLVNHNKMLRLYSDTIGVKTGFTKRSGRCLVSAAERNGLTLIAVTLNAPDDWNDHARMLDYGFSAREGRFLAKSGEKGYSLPVVGGRSDTVTVRNTSELSVALPTGHGEIHETVELPRFLYAPVWKGEILGKIVYRCDADGDGKEEIVAELPLVAAESIRRPARKKSFWQWLRGIFGR